MADQQNRGGKKEGTGKPEDSQKHQGVETTKPRPPEGQPGGPKQHRNQTRNTK